MNRVSILSTALLTVALGGPILSGCSSAAEKATEELPMMSAEEEKAALRREDPVGAYGHELRVDAVTPISDLVTHATERLGETVRIEGTIDEVCPMRGCWVDMVDDSGNKMRIKVTDGQIVFPLSAKGHRAVAEGTLLKIEYDAEQAMAYRAHLAEERGEVFDPESTERGPMVVWQLDGKGAVISD